MLAPSGGMNALQAGLLGAADGLTMNWGDDAADLVGAHELADSWRSASADARRDHGLAYTGGNVASVFVPGLGMGRMAAMGARGLGAAMGMRAASTAGGRALQGIGNFVGGAALGGAAYGQMARAGEAEGSIPDRLQQTATLGNVGMDALYGLGGGVAGATIGGALGGLMPMAMSGVSRGVNTAVRQNAARGAYDARLAGAEADAARSGAAATATAGAAANDARRMFGNELMEGQERGGMIGEGAALQQEAANDYGLTLLRSQAADPRLGNRQLAEALDGVYGPEAQARARELMEMQYNQVPEAFRRVVDGDGFTLPSSATAGSGNFMDALAARNAAERANESALWDNLDQFQDVRLRTREPDTVARWRAEDPMAESDRGMPALVRAVEDRLRGPAKLGERADDGSVRTLFDHPDQFLRDEARQTMPRSAALYDRLKALATQEGAGTMQNPGLFRDLIALRRSARRAYENAAPNSPDARAAQQIRNAIDDWMDSELPDQIVSRGAGAVDAYNAARQATRENRSLFSERPQAASAVSREPPTAEGFLRSLIGADGVNPMRGAPQTLRMMRDRFAIRDGAGNVVADGPEWRQMKGAVLARFTDRISDALERDNVHGLRTVFNQLDNLLDHQPEFLQSVFSPTEIERLGRLRVFIGMMQTPGPAASGPSVRGMAAALNALPGASQAMKIFNDVVGANYMQAAQQRALPRPGVVWPTVGSTLKGAIVGPGGFAGNMSFGAANNAFAQQSENARDRMNEMTPEQIAALQRLEQQYGQ